MCCCGRGIHIHKTQFYLNEFQSWQKDYRSLYNGNVHIHIWWCRSRVTKVHRTIYSIFYNVNSIVSWRLRIFLIHVEFIKDNSVSIVFLSQWVYEFMEVVSIIVNISQYDFIQNHLADITKRMFIIGSD